MATFTAQAAFNYGTFSEAVPIGGASLPVKTATQISAVLGSERSNYFGTNFAFNGSDLTGGTLTRITYLQNGVQRYEISGLSYQMGQFDNYGQEQIAGMFNDLFSGPDVMNGSSAGDSLHGFSGDDTLKGNGGNDYLQDANGGDSLGGLDSLLGGSGDDTLTGQAGDTLRGGAGDDQYWISASGGMSPNLIEELDAGIDFVLVRGGFYVLPANIENGSIAPGYSNAGIRGNSLGNGLSGLDLADRLEGWSGNDNVSGGGGNDILRGNSGTDTLLGGTGADRLEGGAGKDFLTGGTGNDKFLLDSLPGAGAADEITDFVHAADRILLDHGAFAGIGSSGDALGTRFVSATNIGASSGGTGVGSGDRILYDSDSGSLYYDSNGSGAGGRVLLAVVRSGSNPAALTESDFAII